MRWLHYIHFQDIDGAVFIRKVVCSESQIAKQDHPIVLRNHHTHTQPIAVDFTCQKEIKNILY